MIFEKSLEHPPYSWNMAQGKFLFQEDEKVPQVYLIMLHEDKQA